MVDTSPVTVYLCADVFTHGLAGGSVTDGIFMTLTILNDLWEHR